jgi:hypothetical protein
MDRDSIHRKSLLWRLLRKLKLSFSGHGGRLRDLRPGCVPTEDFLVLEKNGILISDAVMELRATLRNHCSHWVREEFRPVVNFANDPDALATQLREIQTSIERLNQISEPFIVKLGEIVARVKAPPQIGTPNRYTPNRYHLKI